MVVGQDWYGGVGCCRGGGVCFLCALCAQWDMVCCVRSWHRAFVPSMFPDSHVLHVHGHGWWGWHATCGALGRVLTVCVGALSHKLCERGDWAPKSMCGRRLCVPACAQPMVSDKHMCCELVHV